MRQLPRLVSLSLTTTGNAAVPFVSNGRLWLAGGNFQVATNSLDVGAVPERSSNFSNYSVGSDISMAAVPLHELLVKPTVAAAHGTLTLYGVVFDNEEDFTAWLYGGGGR